MIRQIVDRKRGLDPSHADLFQEVDKGLQLIQPVEFLRNVAHQGAIRANQPPQVTQVLMHKVDVGPPRINKELKTPKSLRHQGGDLGRDFIGRAGHRIKRCIGRQPIMALGAKHVTDGVAFRFGKKVPDRNIKRRDGVQRHTITPDPLRGLVHLVPQPPWVVDDLPL